MKLKLSKIQIVIKKNLEFTFLLLLIIFTIFSIKIYNVNKHVINQNYINLINNTYFQKSIKHVFDNLEPKFVDIRKENYLIDIDKIKKAISKRTKAIIFVHIYGCPSNFINSIKDLKKNN